MLGLICARVLHLAATCTSLGGLVYARAVVLPTVGALPPDARATFLARAIRRYGYIKWTGVAVVAATGVVGWAHNFPLVPARLRAAYAAAFALKMMGAAGLFAITAQLALPLGAFRGMRERRAFWSAVNVGCGLVILIGAALMRAVRQGG
jgi:uncharacterized membrane protein